MPSSSVRLGSMRLLAPLLLMAARWAAAEDYDETCEVDGSCSGSGGADAPKVAVLSIMQGDMGLKEWIPITKLNHKAYCKERGYDYVLWDQNLSERTPHWEKLEAALELMDKDYDIIYWTDADSIFTNFSAKIEDLLPPDKDFAFSGDWNLINSGHWAVRNTERAADFLEDVLEFYPMPYPNWDNAAFSIRLGGCMPKETDRWLECLRAVDQGFINRKTRARVEEGLAYELIDKDLQKMVVLQPKKRMNGYPGDWQVGDPVLHTVDRPDNERSFWTSLALNEDGTPRDASEFTSDITDLDEKAREMMMERKYDEALQLYHRALLALGLADNSAAYPHAKNQINFNMGIAFSRLNRPWKAVNAFQRAVDDNPEDIEAWKSLASSYMQMRSRFYQIWQYPLAMAALKEASKLIAEKTKQKAPVLHKKQCKKGRPCEIVDLSV